MYCGGLGYAISILDISIYLPIQMLRNVIGTKIGWCIILLL